MRNWAAEVEGFSPPWVVNVDDVHVRDTAVAVSQHVQATPGSLVQLRRYQMPSCFGEDMVGRFAAHQ